MVLTDQEKQVTIEEGYVQYKEEDPGSNIQARVGVFLHSYLGELVSV
jgi:hypothetical protein